MKLKTLSLNLEELLTQAIQLRIEEEKKPQQGNLSGSNALLFDDYNFEAEKSDNCPRLALARRCAGIESPRTIESWISNSHGRTFEELLRVILRTQDIQFKEEEEVEVSFKNENDELLLTARPDKLIFKDGKKYPVEVKTIQSGNTAYYVFIKERPQLAALIQIAVYMLGHQLKKGYILYCASNWFFGFAGKGNSWKVTPSFKIFEIEEIDGEFFYNNKKSIVTSEKIFSGAQEYLDLKKNNKFPPKPQWVDALGEIGKYDGCNYCFFKETCKKMEEENETKLDVFLDRCRALVRNGNSNNKEGNYAAQ
jgi:hypothetical protein